MYIGGAILSPADFHGLAALLLTSDALDDRDEQRMKAAIETLRKMNPLVEKTLTCFEEEIRAQGTAEAQQFNFSAGAGAVPLVVETQITGLENTVGAHVPDPESQARERRQTRGAGAVTAGVIVGEIQRKSGYLNE